MQARKAKVDLVPVYQYDASACADSAEEEAVKEEERNLLQAARVDVDKPKIMKVPAGNRFVFIPSFVLLFLRYFSLQLTSTLLFDGEEVTPHPRFRLFEISFVFAIN
jgi:hypothetical protein